MRRLLLPISLLLFVLGVGSLALTLYLWLGDWPDEMRETVDHMRSVAENTGRPPEPLLPNPRSEPHESLNGTWKAVIDPYDRGALGGIAPLAREPGAPADLAEFSFENGLTLEVPGDWNTQDPKLVFYQGIVWYKRTFSWSAASGTRTFLYFGAANYHASVYLNGRLVGEHEGGFTPFNFDVSDALQSGENLLVVKVDNRRDAADIPTPTTDWHNYGGLTRDVLLVRVPETRVGAFELRLEGEPGDRLVGFVSVVGPDLPATVAVSVPELGLLHEARTDVDGRVELDLVASPARWSPASPRLYDVEVSAGAHRLAERIGFRTLALADGEILLNGDPVFLRGISIHDEILGGGGRTHSAAHAEATLGLALELGCNFVRLSHYPHPEAIVRTADRLGLIVWEELPVYWNVAFEREDTLALARSMFSELIARDRNRASVAFWSLGNETPPGEARDRFFAELAGHVRAEDPSRLLTAALLTGPEALAPFLLESYLPAVFGWRRGEWTFRIDDGLEAIVDVPALNEYFGWYYSGAIGMATPLSSERARRLVLDNMDRIRFVTSGGKPLIVSELGAGAKQGWRAEGPGIVVYSEDYQALVYERQLAMLEQQPNVRGISPWVLKDFRAPLRLYQGVQDHWNRKGLVSETGERKLAFDVLRSHYEALAEEG